MKTIEELVGEFTYQRYHEDGAWLWPGQSRLCDLVRSATAEAAAEIERLRAENERMIHDKANNLVLECGEKIMNDLIALRKKNATLRAAIKLQQAIYQGNITWDEVDDDDVEGWMKAAAERLREREVKG